MRKEQKDRISEAQRQSWSEKHEERRRALSDGMKRAWADPEKRRLRLERRTKTMEKRKAHPRRTDWLRDKVTGYQDELDRVSLGIEIHMQILGLQETLGRLGLPKTKVSVVQSRRTFLEKKLARYRAELDTLLSQTHGTPSDMTEPAGKVDTGSRSEKGSEGIEKYGSAS